MWYLILNTIKYYYIKSKRDVYPEAVKLAAIDSDDCYLDK